MAPKRKAATKQAKTEANSINDEASKQKESASLVSEKRSSKKAKPEPPVSPVKTRARPAKTSVPEPKKVAKSEETKQKSAKPPKESKSKDVKAEDTKHTKPASEVAEALKKEADAAQPPAEESKLSKHIIIEHCKQCNSFKTRATKVKEVLEVKVQGVKVSVNLEKPRKGCFEIRDDEGNIYVSLLDMPRPFKKMKELDLDTTIAEMIEKIK